MTQWVIVVYLCSPLIAPSTTTGCMFEAFGPYPSEEVCLSANQSMPDPAHSLYGRWCAHGCSPGKRVRANLHQAAFGVTLLVSEPLGRRLVLARSSDQHGGAARPGGNARARGGAAIVSDRLLAN
jgi:hypothetical protein